jgi:Family of unknown function (DUF6084)
MTATEPPAVAAGAAPGVAFDVLGAAPVEHAAAPTLRLALQARSEADIRSILLHVQVMIAARRRAYGEEDHARLFELFGAPSAWPTTLRSLLWTRQTLVVPPFTGTTVVDLDVPCTYDFEVAATRYFDALPDGDVPLELVFSGALFYVNAAGLLQTVRISWDVEAEYRLPVRIWKETMERHFRGTAWLRLRKDVVDRLGAHRSRTAAPTWEDAIEDLLDGWEAP